MSFSNFMFGSQPSLEKVDTMNKGQQQYQNSTLQMLNQMLGKGGGVGQANNFLQQLLSGSPEAFQNFEAPYMRQFNQEIVPGIAERFSGMGSGAQRSSAFQQSLGQAGAGLSQNLASMRSGMQMNGISQLLNMLQSLNPTAMKDSFAYMQNPGSQGFLAPMLGAALGGMTGGLGQLGGLAAGSSMFPKTFQALTK